MVFQAARAGDHDVDALAQFLNLGLWGDAAEDGDRPQIRRSSQRRERRVDLRDEFTRWGEDECPRTSRGALGLARCESRHHWQQERVCLAGTGPAAAQDIATCKRI